MKTTTLALLLILAATPFSRAQTAPPAVHVGDASPAVSLFDREKQIVFSDIAQARLRQQIISLLKSSNFHSGRNDKNRIFTFSGVQQDYRDIVATGEYLLMILSTSQKIITVGGEVIAAEIVVGLQGLGGKHTVFTIDELGTVVGHAKYSGEMYLELVKTVAQSRP